MKLTSDCAGTNIAHPLYAAAQILITFFAFVTLHAKETTKKDHCGFLRFKRFQKFWVLRVQVNCLEVQESVSLGKQPHRVCKRTCMNHSSLYNSVEHGIVFKFLLPDNKHDIPSCLFSFAQQELFCKESQESYRQSTFSFVLIQTFQFFPETNRRAPTDTRRATWSQVARLFNQAKL